MSDLKYTEEHIIEALRRLAFAYKDDHPEVQFTAAAWTP